MVRRISIFNTKSVFDFGTLRSTEMMRPSSPAEMKVWGHESRRASLWAARLCWATFFVDLKRQQKILDVLVKLQIG